MVNLKYNYKNGQTVGFWYLFDLLIVLLPTLRSLNT